MPFATRCPISMIPLNRSSKFIDWCEVVSIMTRFTPGPTPL
jgi:hypothetical protein